MARHNVREQIIEAGLKVLLAKGFNGCGVQEITEAAGVPKGSFYNHFESKEALGAEIVEHYGRSNPKSIALADTSVPPLERLRRHFESLSTTYIESGYCSGCLLGNFSAELADQSPLIRERLVALFATWTTDLETVIREGQSDGSITAGIDPGDLAGVLLDAYEGALLRARVQKTRDAFDRFMTVAFSKILI
jgi:TetR/AcrR family transcriptional regulator, transcriptional repressor for nem operon